MNDLTGKWFIKRTLFGFYIMVQIKFKNNKYFPEPIETTKYVKASRADLIELGIHIL